MMQAVERRREWSDIATLLRIVDERRAAGYISASSATEIRVAPEEVILSAVFGGGILGSIRGTALLDVAIAAVVYGWRHPDLNDWRGY